MALVYSGGFRRGVLVSCGSVVLFVFLLGLGLGFSV